MTPTASRLKERLEDRRRWFDNQWLCKWHYIGGERLVEIDKFDGTYARYCGIKFDGSPRLIFWDAIARGVRKEILDQFTWVDGDLRNYNRETALRAIDECAVQLTAFVRSIRNAAVKKDRILRGDGRNFPVANGAGRWEGASGNDIRAQAEALKTALPDAILTRRKILSSIWNDNQWWIGPTGLMLAIISIILAFIL